MSFRKFQKELELKKEEQSMINTLNSTIESLTQKRDEYIKKAKEELEKDNKSLYMAYVALLKNAMFNLAQSQDMLANYIIAKDLREMQSLNKDFVKSIDKIMKNVYKTSKSIKVNKSQKQFNKAIYAQNQTSSQLKNLLKDNNFSFSNSVNSLSDISDNEVYNMLKDEIKKDDVDFENTLNKLEESLSINEDKEETPQQIVIGKNENFENKKEIKKSKEEKDNSKEIKEKVLKEYVYPPLSLLENYEENAKIHLENENEIMELKEILENKLKEFHIGAKVENCNVGSTFSRIELRLDKETRVSQISDIINDVAVVLKRKVRLQTLIEGKDLIGIEVSNTKREVLTLKSILETNNIKNDIEDINVCLGVDVDYKPMIRSFDDFPHLLIGGSTGSGKSVFLHSLICSLLFNYSPKEVQLVLLDFKRVEFGMYNNIPHLLNGKVIDEVEDASEILEYLNEEMDKRYSILLENSVRNIKEYNQENENKKMSRIIVFVDEYAELLNSNRPKEDAAKLLRLAQKARACGIHLVVSTQRPDVKIISGNIKVNFTTRIAFSVASHIDSMNILNSSGAEDLIGKGDMLINMDGRITRLQAPFISVKEIKNVVNYVKSNN